MKNQSQESSAGSHAASVGKRHLCWGWWSLLVFLLMGIALEAFHGFKVGAYLNPPNATRRLMWTLAHAHGTLLGLVHIAFAFTVGKLGAWPVRSMDLASVCLRSAGVLMPLGFFLGGVSFYKADPGLGILLVPPGALLLLISVLMTARATQRA